MRRPPVSVIIRVQNKADVLARAIRSVRAQTVAAEIVIVDSGSTDGSVEIAQRSADRLVAIPAEDFTFGGALNRGAEAASAPVHAALSSHCALPHDRWLERALELLSEDGMGAASGKRFARDGQPLDRVVRLDARALTRNPRWSLSNHASVWRAEVWRATRFDEQIAASEDLVFARMVTERGWTVAVDPDLWVPAGHRRRSGPRALFERKRTEIRATATALDLPAFGLADAARWWWSEVARRPDRPFPTDRIDPRRLAALAGVVAGYHDAGRLGRPTVPGRPRGGPIEGASAS